MILIDQNQDDALLKIKRNALKSDPDHSKDFKLNKAAWKHFMDCKNIKDLDDDELKLWFSYDFLLFKESPKPKYPDVFLIHWIIDDISGTNIF